MSREDTIGYQNEGETCAVCDKGLRRDEALAHFQHEARYNEAEQRIEMHLRSRVKQTIPVNHNFSVELNQGETIWTESSYKFRPEQVRSISERAGFNCEVQWIDEEWPFAQSLLRID